MLSSIAETKGGQPRVNLRSTWGQPGDDPGSTRGQLGVNLGSTWGQARGQAWGQPAPLYLPVGQQVPSQRFDALGVAPPSKL
jgi:hypothetical protein